MSAKAPCFSKKTHSVDFGTGADLAISPLSKFASLLWAFLISVSDVTAIACAIALIGFEIRGGSVISTQADILIIFFTVVKDPEGCPTKCGWGSYITLLVDKIS